MDLGTFIMDKTTELQEAYSYAKFEKVESVVLSKNSVCSEFNSKETPLLQKGKEVNLSEMSEVSSTPFVPNGSIVKFAVKPPRKRKTVSKDYYFLWEN